LRYSGLQYTPSRGTLKRPPWTFEENQTAVCLIPFKTKHG
jgi:hypothetical protein